MIEATRAQPKRPCRNGFTLVELVIAIVVGAGLMTAAYGLLTSMSRLFGVQKEYAATRSNIRSAAQLLLAELSGQSAVSGDLASITSSQISLRSTLAAGVICSKVQLASGGWRFGLQHLSGYFEPASEDSVLVIDMDASTTRNFPLAGIWNGTEAWAAEPSGGGTPVCFWGDSTTAVPRPEATMELSGASAVLENLGIGSPVRVYRRTTYGLHQEDGRWWLGLRVGSDTTFEAVAGPLLGPEAGGLQLTYRGMSGSVTTQPNEVERVDIVLRAISDNAVLMPGGTGASRLVGDSITITTFLRN